MAHRNNGFGESLDPVRFARQVGIVLDEWQEHLMLSVEKRILVNASRQSGKSSVSALLALWEALNFPGSVVLMVSPSMRQSGELFKKSLEAYRRLGRPVPAETENKLSLELENGSRIVSLPGTEGTIRGISGATLLIIDEASRVDDELLAAVRPMMATSGGRLLALSTPNGPVGWWYNAWIGNEQWQRYEVPASECPRISEAFLAEERAALGAVSFAREYLCSFDTPEGALWKPHWIDGHRVRECPPLARVVVGVDPAVTANAGSSETGIVVAGIDGQKHGYVLADLSCVATPDEWARVVVSAYHRYNADRVIAEVNQGGDMVGNMIKQVERGVPFRAVRATRGKYTRAEPVSALYEQGRVHHVGNFPELEKQLLTWVQGEKSPDRLDALVWAFTNLIIDASKSAKDKLDFTSAYSDLIRAKYSGAGAG